MNTLIIKLGASGDVVRTTPLLERLGGAVTWLTDSRNLPLLEGLHDECRCLSWGDREKSLDRRYELVINLEDEQSVAEFAESVDHVRHFGAHVSNSGAIVYTADSKEWFDLSLISAHGRHQADALKLRNRRSYQDLVFAGLGWTFSGEKYRLPRPVATDLTGDVAVAPVAGPAWPMKNWAGYEELAARLRENGLVVNTLPRRATLLEHLGDIAGHRCLVSGDSLPMHLGLGLGLRCVSLFTCTSPWEIFDYGHQVKIVSPRIEEFFYRRDFDPDAVSAISVDEVLAACLQCLQH
jgi:hypothetical protein